MKTTTSLRQRARTAAVALALSVGLAAVAAPVASATHLVYLQGSTFQLSPGSAWAVGPAHSITQHTSTVAYDVCVGAIDVYGGGLSGAGICSSGWPAWTNVSHPYCGCVLRDPADYPYVGPVGFVGYADEDY